MKKIAPTNTNTNQNTFIDQLAAEMLLGPLMERVLSDCGPYTWIDHWKQGEFHHDIILKLTEPCPKLPGQVLVVATNCNGGIKEVLCFQEIPDRWALWHHRCPDNAEFSGDLPEIFAQSRTIHWFDPCELLTPDARSELIPACRRRQRGGGWRSISESED